MRPGNCSGSYSAPPRASAIACRSSSPPREVEATTFSILILAIGTTTAVLRRPERSPQPPGERPNLNTHLNRYRPRPVTSGRTPPPLVQNPTGSGDFQPSPAAHQCGPRCVCGTRSCTRLCCNPQLRGEPPLPISLGILVALPI